MRKIKQFLEEVIAEFKNISWPKKDALLELTVVVISISLIVSLILGAFDYLFTQSFNLLGGLKTPPPTQKIDILPSSAPSPTPTIKK